MNPIRTLKQASRPIRRRITPREFKEFYINAALSRFENPTYLEIGVRWGESMRNVKAARKIGIDPVRHPAMDHLLAGEEFHQYGSDEFFSAIAENVLTRGGVHVALVDGLHEFHQTLRDIFHLEPFMADGGLIVLDDCNPPSADRAVDTPTGGAWNGDVWKSMAFVRREIPDLSALTVDRDQGVGLIWGFEPRQGIRVIRDDLISEYKALPYEKLEAGRKEILGLQRASLRDLRAIGAPV